MANGEDEQVEKVMKAPLSRQKETLRQWGYGDVGLLILMSSCDGACFFCAQPTVTHAPTSLITKKSQIDAWFDTKPPPWILLGGTEPMSHPDFFYALQKIHQGGACIELMTSGVRIHTLEMAEKLYVQGVRRICVPLYSSEPNIHDAIVGV